MDDHKMRVSERYLNEEYLASNSDWHAKDSKWKSDHIIQLLKKNNIRPKTLCEIGCGAGEILCYLHRKNISSEIDGYDISPMAIEICSTKEKENLNFHLKNIDDISKTYDCLLCIDVLEHVEDYIGFTRNLKPLSNYKIFHIPLDISFAGIAFNWMNHARESVGHLHYFTYETALATLAEADLEVLDYFFTAPFLIESNRSSKIKDILIYWIRRIVFSFSPKLLSKTLGGCSMMVLAK